MVTRWIVFGVIVVGLLLVLNYFYKRSAAKKATERVMNYINHITSSLDQLINESRLGYGVTQSLENCISTTMICVEELRSKFRERKTSWFYLQAKAEYEEKNLMKLMKDVSDEQDELETAHQRVPGLLGLLGPMIAATKAKTAVGIQSEEVLRYTKLAEATFQSATVFLQTNTSLKPENWLNLYSRLQHSHRHLVEIWRMHSDLNSSKLAPTSNTTPAGDA